MVSAAIDLERNPWVWVVVSVLVVIVVGRTGMDEIDG